MTTRSFDRRHSEAGFTLMEMVIVIAIIGTMLVWIVPSFLGTLNRTRMVSASKEIATQLQIARLEAIKKGGINGDLRNRVTAVLYEKFDTHRWVRIMIDETADAAWNPVTQVGPPVIFPKGVTLQAPTQGPDGTLAIAGWDDVGPDQFAGPIFLSDGSVTRAGAFRIADERGNFLEIAVVFPATGKIAIQKWFGGGDPATNWYENGENQMKWEW